MAEVLLFHSAHGLTSGMRHFAESLRGAGHTVHLPDLYEGQVFPDLGEGLAFAQATGFGVLLERGRAAAQALPPELVYAGFSLGVVPAQVLARTRAAARGALLLSACLPPSDGETWPQDVPVQVHGMDADPFFVDEGDLDAARALVAEAADGELFLYPGEQHLFADDSLPSYDEPSAALLTQRVLDFLERLDQSRAAPAPAS
jgi:dienelactone hydrolase